MASVDPKIPPVTWIKPFQATSTQGEVEGHFTMLFPDGERTFKVTVLSPNSDNLTQLIDDTAKQCFAEIAKTFDIGNKVDLVNIWLDESSKEGGRAAAQKKDGTPINIQNEFASELKEIDSVVEKGIKILKNLSGTAAKANEVAKQTFQTPVTTPPNIHSPPSTSPSSSQSPTPPINPIMPTSQPPKLPSSVTISSATPQTSVKKILPGASQDEQEKPTPQTVPPSHSSSASHTVSKSVTAVSDSATQPLHGLPKADFFTAKDEKGQGITQGNKDLYQTPLQLVGFKTNKNSSLEPVYFGTAACTPMAIAFVAGAKSQQLANEFTPRKILDSMLGLEGDATSPERALSIAKCQRGVQQVRTIIRQNVGVDFAHMNLNADHGVEVYNAMLDPTATKLKIKSSYELEPKGYMVTEGDTALPGDQSKWYEKLLNDLKAGQGALITFGGYSIGLRRIGDKYEIFDSHNASSYTGKQGTCITQCKNREDCEKYLDEIRRSGSFGAVSESDDKSGQEDLLAGGVNACIFEEI